MKSVKPLPTPTNPLLANAQELGAHIRAARTQSGLTLEEAVATAKAYVHAAIAAADRLKIGQGHGPTHHFHAYW